MDKEIKTTDWLTRGIPKKQLEQEKQEAIMSADLEECLTEFSADDDIYVDFDATAEKMFAKGYHKQSEGEWKYPPYAPSGGSYEMRRCSVCGYKPDFDSDNPYTKFCPNCGARMKGESND